MTTIRLTGVLSLGIRELQKELLERLEYASGKPYFPIGKLLATPAVLEALQEADVDIIDLVERHICKDLGDLSDDDKRLNDEALHDGSRILSAYVLPKTDVKIWTITEAADDRGERAATTSLLPKEY